jgi:uncharacterized protein
MRRGIFWNLGYSSAGRKVMTEKVVVLGASENPERYSYKAFQMLREYGHEAIPVNPKLKRLDGVEVFSSLDKINFPVDTLTVYVGPEISAGLEREILALKPRRVIFNPGSESPELQRRLTEAEINVEEACTLVLLRTKQF